MRDRNPASILRTSRVEEFMAKDSTNTGGPSHKPKQSRDELQDRSVHGDRPGEGRRNGSDKAPRG